MSQQMPLEVLLQTGQQPAFRLPIARPRGGDLRDAMDGAGVVFLGVPWDGGATLHAGARHAPFSIRQASLALSGFHERAGVDVFTATRAVDGGNVALTPFDAALMRECVALEVEAVARGGARPFLLGGDHSITLPALRGIAAVHGPVVLVHVDAHADTSSAAGFGVDHHHGTWLRHALAEGLVATGGLCQLGLRGPWKDATEHDCARGVDAMMLSADAIAARGVPAVSLALLRLCGDRPVYLSFDVDAVDPAVAPGTGVPVPGGLSAREALALVRGLCGVNLVGADVVEVAPALDQSAGGVGLTSLLAAHVLFEATAAAACSVSSASPSR